MITDHTSSQEWLNVPWVSVTTIMTRLEAVVDRSISTLHSPSLPSAFVLGVVLQLPANKPGLVNPHEMAIAHLKNRIHKNHQWTNEQYFVNVSHECTRIKHLIL